MPAVSTRTTILRLLSDGKFHSGPEIGHALGLTRAAVNKSVKGLIASGLEIHSVGGRGYRLESPIQPLTGDAILVELGDERRYWRDRLQILEEVDSTSQYLLRQLAAGTRTEGQTCVAEVQNGGRGRRGRGWVASPYRNILLSLAWGFDAGPPFAAGLSLAAGVAVVRALRDIGVTEAALKWPNDILVRERKLAGLLADVRGEAGGPVQVVLGIGLNVQIEPPEAQAIDQPWIDLRAILGTAVDRNRLVALILRHVRSVLDEFGRRGLPAFRDEWLRYHVYNDRRVRVRQGEQWHEGVIQDIDASGALVLRDTHGALQTFHSGEVSLRPARSGS